MASPNDITRLLDEWQKGSDDALTELMPLVYDKLKSLAEHHMRGENRHHTLQATALVNEAFLRLNNVEVAFENQAHFIALASTLMRRVLVDHARGKHSAKRGGGQRNLTFEENLVAAETAPISILDLNDALDELATQDPEMVKIVELVYFGGLKYEEAAMAMGMSRSKFAEELQMAKAWIKVRLAQD